MAFTADADARSCLFNRLYDKCGGTTNPALDINHLLLLAAHLPLRGNTYATPVTRTNIMFRSDFIQYLYGSATYKQQFSTLER